METYRIAKYLEPEHRRRAAEATYVLTPEGSTRALPDKEVCPMGIAFCLGYSPDPREVAEILAEAGGHDYEIVLKAAESFTGDIDCGLIGPDEVAAALGVQLDAAGQPSGAADREG